MSATFGLDFGTTNCVVTYVEQDVNTGHYCARPLLDDDGRPHPSVVWYKSDEPIVGRKAKAQLGELGLGVFGDVVRSPKTYLGKPTGLPIGEVTRSAVEVVADILSFLKQHANDKRVHGNAFEHAVFTVPVSMDGVARRELREAARKAGICIHRFVHEPLAALYGYLRGLKNFRTELARLEGEIMLVFDWGGGTLDLTLCRLENGILTQIANSGDSWDLGGDKFDQRIRRKMYELHEASHPDVDLTKLQPGAEARIIEECEDAKISLSDHEERPLFIPDVLAVSDSSKDLDLTFSRTQLEESVSDLVRAGVSKIDALLESVDLSPNSVKFCLATGGMVAMPAIKRALHEKFGRQRVKFAANSSTIISEGAAWLAHDDIPITLAKPFEVLSADDSYVSIVHSGLELPVGGQSIPPATFSMYCVDPSDGCAKFLFARPRFPNRESHNDQRVPYLHITLPVDPHVEGRQFLEKLEVSVRIDDNLIATIQVDATGRGERRICEIYDLEFGLSLNFDIVAAGNGGRKKRNSFPNSGSKYQPGAVRVRSNVAHLRGRRVYDVIPPWLWDLVPGDKVHLYNPHHRLTDRQRNEKMYYAPCCICSRTAYQIMEMGGDCGCKSLTNYDGARRRNLSGRKPER